MLLYLSSLCYRTWIACVTVSKQPVLPYLSSLKDLSMDRPWTPSASNSTRDSNTITKSKQFQLSCIRRRSELVTGSLSELQKNVIVHLGKLTHWLMRRLTGWLTKRLTHLTDLQRMAYREEISCWQFDECFFLCWLLDRAATDSIDLPRRSILATLQRAWWRTR